MEKLLFIIGYFGIVLTCNEGPGAPNIINWLGVLIVLASIIIYKLSKEK